MFRFEASIETWFEILSDISIKKINWNGMKWNEMEWNGMKWNEME